MATRVEVHGHVQGVFFRASTRDLAKEHGVTGWVRNDPHGTVTAHLEGDEQAVAAVLEWIGQGGPRRADVRDVRTTTVDDEGHDDFTVRH